VTSVRDRLQFSTSGCQVRCHELGSRCLAMHELSCAAIDQGNKLEGDDSSSAE